MSKGQTSNRFEVLGKIPKPKVLASQNPIHISKESGSFELQIFFQKDKFFISNDISKTRRFYEFILVDMESIQVSHIKNPEGTDITYSKCKILKIISENDWEQSPFTHKRFSKNFVPQTFDYIDYKEAWFNTFYVRPCPIHGFSIGEKKPKHLFQTGFKNGDSFLELFKTFSVLKLENLLIISKKIVKVFSLWEIAIHYPFSLNLESLGFFVGNLPPIIFCLHHSLGIWLGNSKSNGGHPSNFLKHNPLSPLRIGLTLKSQSPKRPQRQRYLFGPNLCLTQFLGPKLRQKSPFLQIHNTKPISKGLKRKLLKPCLNLQIQRMMRKTQP